VLVKFISSGITLLSLFLSGALAYGEESSLETLLQNELKKAYNGAEINLMTEARWVRGSLGDSPVSVKLLGDDSKGNAHFLLSDLDPNKSAEGWIGFSAWLPARIAITRIKPGQLISDELFLTQKVNVAVGQAKDYRGIILTEHVELKGLEAIQTVLEGQFLTTAAVQRVPDVRRGDSVRIHVITGGLSLTTIGVAEEPSYLHRTLRVMTGKNKRELVGMLLPGGIVEVKL
jgi:flagella basal body P-ring formation protein FlgA